MRYRIVEAESAGEVVALEAVSGQDSAGDITAQTALADDIDGFALVYFIQPFPQFIHRDVEEPVYMPAVVLGDRAGIQQRNAAIAGELIRVFQMPLFQDSV